MARFSTAPVQEVAPKRKQRQPSRRAQVQQQYQAALRKALSEQHALIVELEPEDKPLTIRNRIKRAADMLELQNVTIRRRRDRIIAYQAFDDTTAD